MSNNKGFTVIEVMLAVLLAGIITSAIGFFMVANIQSYQTSKRLTDLQYFGQSSMNQIVDLIMHSEGIDRIGNGTDQNAYNNAVIANNPEFVIKSRDGIYYYFSYDATNTALILSKGNMTSGTSISAEETFANNVSIFTLRAVPEGRTFKTCSGVKIEMTMGTTESSIKMEEEVRYRNK